MSWTKRQFIVAALEEIGIASYEFDLSPEELESALRRLDSMMADWNANGVRLGYPLASIASSNLADNTNVPDSANEAIIYNLAVRLGPQFRRPVQRETKVAAHNGYETLLMRAGTNNPQTRQLPGMLPSGAGNKGWRNDSQNFITPPREDQLAVGSDGIFGLN